MGIKVEKQAIRPGWFMTNLGWQHFTPERIGRIEASTRALLGDGHHVPVPLEHRGDALPTLLSVDDASSLLKRHNTGWLRGVRRDPADQSLWLSLDIDDPVVARSLGRTTLFGSPQIQDYPSGNGKVYREAIVHYALTDKPVDHRQRPFTPVPQGQLAALRFSMTGYCGDKPPPGARVAAPLQMGTPDQVGVVMGEYKRRQSNAGGKPGPAATDRKRAVAVAMKRAGQCHPTA